MSKILMKGCVVYMSSKSGCRGYGNPQCVRDVCEPLGELSLYGHNQAYKTYDVREIVSSPMELIEFMYASCAETVPDTRPAKWKIDLGTEVTFEELYQKFIQQK